MGDWPLRTRIGFTAARIERLPHPTWMIVAAAIGAVAVLAGVFMPEDDLPWLAWDSRTYWDAAHAVDPYANARVGELGAYLYSPAFLQALRPAVLLPWPIFLYLWAAATIAVAWVLVAGRGLPGRWLVPLGVLAMFDVWAGNVNVFIGGAVVLGLRWPVAWSFLALTKVSPFLGVAWFAARGEWRKLAVAVVATISIALLSALADPGAWRTWFAVLVSNSGATNLSGDFAVPALVRFPVAVALTYWGARTDRPWTLPIAVVLLLPVIWPNGLAVLVGCAALVPSREPGSRAGTRRGSRLPAAASAP
jgi:hypothetical protein